MRNLYEQEHSLIVNDDGIHSEGIVRLAQAASRFGRVWVAAPDEQCSGMSQKISIFDPILVRPYDFPAPVEAAWSIGGTPADCVKVAVGYLLDGAPDLVLSGINNGYNAGFDNAYSGTIGAAAEALMKGIPAIAFSRGLNADFEVAEHYLPLLLEELMAAPPVPWELWNVNFPAVPLRDCKGVLYGRRLAPVQLYQELYRREDRPDGSFTLLNTSTPIDASGAPEDSDICSHSYRSVIRKTGLLLSPERKTSPSSPFQRRISASPKRASLTYSARISFRSFPFTAAPTQSSARSK